MPLYEYFCTDCNDTFEQLRPASAADQDATCPACHHDSTQRILSLFASSVKTNGDSGQQAMAMPAMAGGCCGGACGCH
ncbi:MAG: zinc ribbon domain-containing protein [Caldilineaceae bacterium]|nr:zinc ribbon domain-containing protein [Caldilineaceae bacterium]